MEQVNEMLRSELSNAIAIESPMPNALITIKKIKCSPDLKSATIFISVLPDNVSGSALKNLRKSGKTFSKLLKNRIHLKYIPKFNWRLDTSEKYVEEIEQAIKEL